MTAHFLPKFRDQRDSLSGLTLRGVSTCQNRTRHAAPCSPPPPPWPRSRPWANIPAATDGNPDAQLIALGGRLESLLVRRVEMFLRIAEIFHQAQPRAGDPDAENLSDQERERILEAKCAYLHANPNFDILQDREDNLMQQTRSICNEVRMIEPTTLLGLRAHAVAALCEAVPDCYADNYGFDFREDDEDEPRIAFFEAVAAITGLTPLYQKLDAQLSTSATATA